jgi:WD40 repeat protein
VDFHGPVRVSDTTAPGSATITLSLKTWKGVAVASTTHELTVLPVKPRPKVEPIAPNLVASLVHPDRAAVMATVCFSTDGSRLFTSGYPSGIVQIWDVTSKKQIRRIDTPRAYRSGSVNYALLTPDWKTIYVPVEKRSVKEFKRDGKRRYRIEYGGKIRVWDVNSGKEKDPLLPTAGSAPVYAKLAPGGRHLVWFEQPSYDTGENEPQGMMMVWDLMADKKWKLHDGYGQPSFSPDGKTVVDTNDEFKKSAVTLLDLATGKQLAKLDSPDKGRHFFWAIFRPDGMVVAVSLAGKKATPEVWFLDGKFLEVRGRLVGKAGADWRAQGLFTPDGKRYVALDEAGNLFLWDVDGKRLERTLSLGKQSMQRLAISPDGKTLAVGWMPEFDREGRRDIDPADVPQPRVTLVNLAGTAPPRVLIAPHGFVWGLAFSPDGKTLAFGSSGAVHLFDLTR